MSGAKAVINGLNLESKVYAILNRIPNSDIIRSIPYPSVYSLFGNPKFTHKTKMEFRVEDIKLTYPCPTKNGIIFKTKMFNAVNVECKYQEKAGSVDEKYPLVYSNSVISDADTTLFIYDDPNASIKTGALNYVKHLALHSNGRFIVMSLDELIRSVKDTYTPLLSKHSDDFNENLISFVTNIDEVLSDENLALEVIDYESVTIEINENEARNKLINASKFDSFNEFYDDYQSNQKKIFNIHARIGNNVYELEHLFISLRESRFRLLKEIETLNRDLFY